MNEENMNADLGGKKRRNKAAFVISLTALIIILLLCALYFMRGCGIFHGEPAVSEGGSDESAESVESADESGTEALTQEMETEPELPENPINFSAQMAENDEIYAWLYIPGTNVNYPILQSTTDDLYYLRRGVDRKYLIAGVLFTQSHNRRDFSDPVTVVYGHNMSEDGSMFATLHNFEDPDFFAEHEDVFVYTPGHILTYKVVSAYKYDNRHIMNSFNFDDETVRREYFDYVMNPLMFPMNVREGETLETEDKLLVLSTCMANNKYRYLVNAVLVSDESTK